MRSRPTAPAACLTPLAPTAAGGLSAQFQSPDDALKLLNSCIQVSELLNSPVDLVVSVSSSFDWDLPYDPENHGIENDCAGQVSAQDCDVSLFHRSVAFLICSWIARLYARTIRKHLIYVFHIHTKRWTRETESHHCSRSGERRYWGTQ